MSFRPAIALFMGLLLAGVVGCAAIDDKTDYHRHTMSDLREDWRNPGTLLFEASSSSLYPADSDAAEEVRMGWLAAWMKRTGYCPAGWEVLSRTKIEPGEVHARRHDLRYELQCAEPAAKPAN
jgi:hypothetical protein